MAAESKRPFAHLTLLELLIGVTLLAVAGFFLVRGMQQAKEREQRQQITAALNDWEGGGQEKELKTTAESIFALIKANPKLHDAKSGLGFTSLHLAAIYGNRDTAQWLLDHGADVNAKDNNGKASLHWAAYNGHNEIAELLLVKVADVNAKDDRGWTPLHWAAAAGHKETAELLLAKDADVHAKSNNGKTPLDLAKLHDEQPLIELLLKHGAKE